MTAVLISGIVLIAAGMFLLGAYCADRVRAIWWLLDDRRRAWRGYAPAYVLADEPETIPDPPRYGPLLTPPEGYEVPGIRADLPAKRKPTEDHAPTCDFPAVDYAPPPATWAEPPPSIEELRRQYDDWDRATYGRQPVADVLADETQRQDVIA